MNVPLRCASSIDDNAQFESHMPLAVAHEDCSESDANAVAHKRLLSVPPESGFGSGKGVGHVPEHVNGAPVGQPTVGREQDAQSQPLQEFE
jgi:hypothetical protein